MKNRRLNKNNLIVISFLCATVNYSTVFAAPANLFDMADSPLFLATSADPLITIIWDDSGSMLLEQSPENATYSNLAFPVSFSSDSYYSVSKFGTSAGSKLIRDPKTNPLFFDPFKTYKPWIKADGTLMANADYKNLWKSPFKTHPDDKYIQARPSTCGDLDISGTTQSVCYKYTFCDKFTSCTSNSSASFSPGDMYYGGFSYKLSATTKNYAANAFYSGSPAIKTSDILPNAANWYTYYRDRKNIGKAALGYALQDIPTNINLGFTTLSYASSNASAPLMFQHQKFTAENKASLYSTIYNESGFGGTPLRQALLNVNNYIKNTKALWYSGNSPLSCRRAYNIIVSDGGWSNGSVNFTTNSDGTAGSTITGKNGQSFKYSTTDSKSYADSTSATLADIAMEYWKNDIRTDLNNNLSPVPGDANTAFWQHIVTHAISMNGENPTTVPSTWPNMLNADESDRYMDMWHATLNTKGDYLSSTNFENLTNAIKTLLNDASQLTSNVGLVNTGIAYDTYEISSKTKLFKAFFNPNTWSGDIIAYNLDNAGTVIVADGAQPWQASAKVPLPNVRQMLAMLKSGSKSVGVPFRLTNLTSLLGSALKLDTNMIDYIRGVRTKEGYQYQTATQGYRTRSTAFGDFVHSKPLFVGAPSYDYEYTGYEAFKTANASRTPALYIGSNDGFLHAFNANTGVELFAVTPQIAYNKIANQVASTYSHSYSIDGSPMAGDVYFNNAWNTILVTPMGAGGKGLFSINITNPNSITEGSAASLTGNGFWQFDETNDADLGYTFSDTSIARVTNTSDTHKWAVIFGNGYNNTQDDGYVSKTGNAILYVLNAQDGSVIKKIDTGVGKAADPEGLGRPNGLSSPTVVDYNNDGIADYVYAGDIFGNMWKFDISSTDVSKWTSVKVFNNTRNPMQSITTAPDIKKYANGTGVMIYFATGKFIGTDDIASDQTNSIYGVLDNFTNNNIKVDQLVSQTLSNVTAKGQNLRTLSGKTINWQSQYGWVINLPSSELVINKPKLSQGYLLVSSYIPDPSNTVCQNNQKGFIYIIDPTTGGPLKNSSIDVNDDGVIDDNDKVNGVSISGIQINSEYSSDPLVMKLNNAQNKLLMNTQSGGILSVLTARSVVNTTPVRRSWKKVRSNN